MVTLYDCSEETITEFGHCIETDHYIPRQEDIGKIFGIGFTLQQLIIVYVLFVMILGIIMTVVNQPRRKH